MKCNHYKSARSAGIKPADRVDFRFLNPVLLQIHLLKYTEIINICARRRMSDDRFTCSSGRFGQTPDFT